MTIRRLILALVVGAVVIAGLAPDAGATNTQEEPPPQEESPDDDNSLGPWGTLTATEIKERQEAGFILTYDGLSSGSPGRVVPTEAFWEWLWNRRCGYTTNNNGAGDYEFRTGHRVDMIWVGSTGVEGRSNYRAACNRDGDGAGSTSYDGGLFDLVDGSGIGEVDPTRVRNEAAASIAIGSPNIDTNPSFRDRYAIVRFPTWLWVTDPWVPQVRAEVDGVVAVEVTATPVEVVWRFDEPNGSGHEYCSGPGKEWVIGSKNNGDTRCSYTFTHSSAGHGPNDAFEASATWSWDMSWVRNGVDEGVFRTITGSTDFEIQVGEIIAVSSPTP